MALTRYHTSNPSRFGGCFATANPLATPITGNAAAGAVGSVSCSFVLSLTGLAGAASAGTLGSTATYGITGSAATAAVGSLSAAFLLDLAGVLGSGAAGTIVPDTPTDVTAALTGVYGVSAVGSLVAVGPQGATRKIKSITVTKSATSDLITVRVSVPA